MLGKRLSKRPDGLQVMVEKGVMMMNIAIYDADALRKAQENPELYPDLIVRVWGFSARFIDLCREMQDHVISRVMKQS